MGTWEIGFTVSYWLSTTNYTVFKKRSISDRTSSERLAKSLDLARAVSFLKVLAGMRTVSMASLVLWVLVILVFMEGNRVLEKW